MATSSLVVHRGARLVERAELDAIPTPPATETWFPVAHSQVLQEVTGRLADAGFAVRQAQHALSRNDARYFGTLDLDTPLVAGVTLAVGIRNSTDKSLPLGFCAGSRCFVCDNLAFRAELLVSRKHTRFGQTRFGEAIGQAVQSLAAFQQAEAARIRRLQAAGLHPDQADALLLRAYEQKLVSHHFLPRVIQEWRKPSFEEFTPRTRWSLLNAFTTVLGARQRGNPQLFAALTMQLQGLLDPDTPLAVAV
jgi:hypothetical protein